MDRYDERNLISIESVLQSGTTRRVTVMRTKSGGLVVVKTMTYREFDSAKEILNGIHHPYVIRSLGWFPGLFDGRGTEVAHTSKVGSIVFPHMPQGDLFEFVTRNALRLDRREYLYKIKSLFRTAIQGLEAIHLAGLAHLDIKLENIMITPDERKGVLIDFGGVSRIGFAVRSDAGTATLRAPEFERFMVTRENRPLASGAMDIWSAGLALLIALSGASIEHNVREFTGPSREWRRFCIDLCDSQIKSLAAKKLFDESASSTISWMLSVRPEDRPTCFDLLTDPKSWLSV